MDKQEKSSQLRIWKIYPLSYLCAFALSLNVARDRGLFKPTSQQVNKSRFFNIKMNMIL